MWPGIAFEFTDDPLRFSAALALSIFGTLLIGWVTFHGRPARTGGFRAALFILRSLAITGIGILLLEPRVGLRQTKEVRPHYLLLIDRSLSMELPLREGPDGGMSRMEWLEDRFVRDGLFEALASRSDLRLFTFADRADPAARDSLFAMVDRRPSGRTDLSAAMRRALEEEPRPDGILVVTDGRVNAGEDPRSYIREQPPFYFIGTGKDTRNPDTGISEVKSPSRLFEGSPIPLIVTIHSRNSPGGETRLQVFEGEERIRSIPVSLGTGYREVSFSLEGAAAGRHIYRLELEGIPGESFVENNRRHVVVQILSSRHRVLVIGEAPQWDLTFILKALRDMDDLAVDLYLPDPLGTGGVFVTGKEEASNRLAPEALRFDPYDLICLQGGVSAVRVWGDMARDAGFHRTGKGTIFLITEGIGEPEASEVPWSDRLPWPTPGPIGIVAGEFPVLSPVVDPTGLTRLLRDSSANLALWSSLPPLTGRIDRPLGGSGETGEITILKVEGEEGGEYPAVVCEDRKGFRIVSLLGNGFWRWAFHRTDARPGFRRFIEALARWGLGGSSEGGAFHLAPAQALYERGEPLTFILRRGEEAGERFFMVIRSPDGSAVRDTIWVDSDRTAREQVITVGSLPPGGYRVAYGAVSGEAIGQADIFVDSYSTEYADPQPDDRLLEEMGSMSGAAYLDLSVLSGGNLAKYIPLDKIQHQDTRIIVLSTSPIAYIMLLFALISELILRKWRGFP